MLRVLLRQDGVIGGNVPVDAQTIIKDANTAIGLRVVEVVALIGAPDKPCGVGRADANPKLLLNDT